MTTTTVTAAHRAAVDALPDLGRIVVRTSAGTRSFTFAEYTAWKASTSEVHKVARIDCRRPGDSAVIYQIGLAVATPAPSTGGSAAPALQSQPPRRLGVDGAGIGAAEASHNERPPLRPGLVGLHGPG